LRRAIISYNKPALTSRSATFSESELADKPSQRQIRSVAKQTEYLVFF
jgi:hypothetical protein